MYKPIKDIVDFENYSEVADYFGIHDFVVKDMTKHTRDDEETIEEILKFREGEFTCFYDEIKQKYTVIEICSHSEAIDNLCE